MSSLSTSLASALNFTSVALQKKHRPLASDTTIQALDAAAVLSMVGWVKLLQRLFDSAHQLCLRYSADDLLLDCAALEDDQIRNSADAVA